MPVKLSHTERVLTACHASEKAAFSSNMLQHVHLTDGKVEAAVSGQRWECCFKSPLYWGAWQGWRAKEPSVEQCLAMCIIITALVAKFSVSSCAVLAAVLKSKALEQILPSVNGSYRNPFYVQSQELIVNLIEVLAVLAEYYCWSQWCREIMQVLQLILSNNTVQNVILRVPVSLGSSSRVPRSSLERQSTCVYVFLGAGRCDWPFLICLQLYLMSTFVICSTFYTLDSCSLLCVNPALLSSQGCNLLVTSCWLSGEWWFLALAPDGAVLCWQC